MTKIALEAKEFKCATYRIAPTTAAPDEIPQRMPSSLASRLAMSMLSLLFTRITSSMMLMSSTLGTKPAPIPWICAGHRLVLMQQAISKASGFPYEILMYREAFTALRSLCILIDRGWQTACPRQDLISIPYPHFHHFSRADGQLAICGNSVYSNDIKRRR